MTTQQLGAVVPTLNSSAMLEWTLCALRSQKDVALEILVADSGSDDETLDICASWGVRTIYVPPGNMYRAINAGLRQMDTEWVTYLNSDDVVYPQSYARLIARGEQQRASLVYGDCDFIDHEGRFLFALKSPVPSRLLGLLQHGHFGFMQPAAIYRRDTFQKLGGFDEQYRHIADYDFFFRLISSGYPVARLEGPAVAAFRRYASQLSSRESAIAAGEMRSFRNCRKVKVTPRSIFDLFSWYLENYTSYLWRLASRRAWPPKIF